MRSIIITITLIVISGLAAKAQSGMPFFVNFSEEVYGAQSNNFDVVCDDHGTVFFANFEGLLYYDQSRWRMIHTNNVQRITALHKAASGTIIVGGNNYLATLTASANGALGLKPIIEKGNFGEVDEIWQEGNSLWLTTVSGNTYMVSEGRLTERSGHTPPSASDIQEYHGELVNNTIKTADGTTLLATNNGLVAIDPQGREAFVLNESSGLCNNKVNKIASDGHGGVWGATDSGIFYADIGAGLRRYCQSEGLMGTVLSATKYCGIIYAGTQQGLFKYSGGNQFSKVARVGQMCYCLFNAPDGSLLAATGEGVFRITSAASVEQLSSASSMAVTMTSEGKIYSGEMDGIYMLTIGGSRKLVSSGTSRAENINKLALGKHGETWAMSVNGDYYVLPSGATEFRKATAKEIVSNSQATIHKRFFPNFSYTDHRG